MSIPKLVTVTYMDSPKSTRQIEKKRTVLCWRTILEADGYGENYEPIDDCGKIGGYIGQYLGES